MRTATLTLTASVPLVADASGADVTLSLDARGFARDPAHALAALRDALASLGLDRRDVTLRHLHRGSWAWWLAVAALPVCFALIVHEERGLAMMLLGATLTLAHALGNRWMPTLSATLDVACRDGATLDRVLDLARTHRGVTPGAITPRGSADLADAERRCWEEAHARASAMAARAGMRVTALRRCELLPTPTSGGVRVEPMVPAAVRSRASLGGALEGMSVASAGASVTARFVFVAEGALNT